ncbi:Anhydro-N-acetylmuramic acid kinase [Palleronia abyssalis]|uniref:Anhydro-N-acetylmuramic acid kinase n=2 Tax=Palleronia abyssalis TaxID=1501240 RepID=A0A2R8BQH2_9RHOB|nr:Anhydro-N-acetylmuramic acid kinase [Palleronia abyssalis]
MLKDALRDGSIWALGAAPDRSLNGVDAAMVLTDGAQIFGFGQTAHRPFQPEERAVLSAAMGRWDKLEEASAVVESVHAELLSTIPGADLVGFHGLTTAHEPHGRGSCQIGDGRLLAHVLDIPVVWDFRSADIEMGGQGTPLIPFFHHAALRNMGNMAPAVIVDLGDIGRLSFVDPTVEIPSDTGGCLALDTGPANALIRDLIQARPGLDLDTASDLAARGAADGGILDQFAADGYFRKMPPKSLIETDFGWLSQAVSELSDADACATVTAAAAAAVVLALEHLPSMPARLLVIGDGRRNATMMEMIRAGANVDVLPVEDIGLDGDKMEAQAFAYLAVRVLRGWPTSAPGTTGVAAAVGGGVVSYPGDILQALGN